MILLRGIKKADGEYVVVPDRKEAIKYAIVNANDGDGYCSCWKRT